MNKAVNKKNGIWEWHDVLINPTGFLHNVDNFYWLEYTNKGGGETIIGRYVGLKDSEFYSKSVSAFNDCVEEYAACNGITVSSQNVGVSPLILREYNPGSKMTAHSDFYGYLKKDGGKVTPLLTAILYLNDDYEGGEINFIDDGLCIKPKAGSMIVFPSDIQHEVLELKSGNRYMIQTYIYENQISFYDEVING